MSDARGEPDPLVTADREAFEATRLDGGRNRSLRPRDSATLMILDRSAGEARVLIGRRHRDHAFMPGKFVFPGGRTDPTDARVPIVSQLHPAEQARLIGATASCTPARARAIALSALRETWEEAGLLIGRAQHAPRYPAGWEGFFSAGVVPALDGLRVVARAVTPPGGIRRFDTRFLAVWRGEVAHEMADGGPTGELEELAWLSLSQAARTDVPAITKKVLGDLAERLRTDPELAPGCGEAPFYRIRHNRVVRTLL